MPRQKEKPRQRGYEDDGSEELEASDHEPSGFLALKRP